MADIATGSPGQIFPEVYYRRVGYSTESTQAMGTTGTDCRLSFRLMPIEYAIRVSGICLSAATGVADDTLMRLYLQRASQSSPFLPSGATIFDTGAAGFTWGNSNLTAASVTSGDKHKIVNLSSPVDIATPGLYWLGVFTQTPAATGSAGGSWRTTNLRGWYNGLGDLVCTLDGTTHAAVTNAQFATHFTPPTTVLSADITRAADTDTCCIDFGLVCQRI